MACGVASLDNSDPSDRLMHSEDARPSSSRLLSKSAGSGGRAFLCWESVGALPVEVVEDLAPLGLGELVVVDPHRQEPAGLVLVGLEGA